MKRFFSSQGKLITTLVMLGSGALLLSLTQPVNFSQVYSSLLHVGAPVFLLAVGLSLLQILCQASRLWALIPQSMPLALSRVVSTFIYGQFLNSFAPARAGDGFKIYGLQKDSPLTTGAATGVILADKIIDITALIILMISVGLPLSQLGSSLPSWISKPVLIGSVVGGVLLGLWGIYVCSARARQVLNSLLVGMSGLLKPWPLGLSLGIAFCVWGVEGIIINSLASSQGVSLEPSHVIWVLVVLNVGIAIPVSLANLGVFEAAMVFGLTSVGMPIEAALAISVVHHGAQLLSLFVAFGVVRFFPVSLPANERPKEFHVRSEDKARSLNYYRSLSNRYESHVNRGPLYRLRQRERQAILELSQINHPTPSSKYMSKRMIDVGCGSGFYIQEAKKNGWWVCAMDVVPEFVTHLSPYSDEQIVADVEKLESNAQYDVVICAGVLDFVSDPDRALSNLCRLVSPQGSLVIQVPRKGLGGLYYRFEKMLFGLRVNLFTEAWCKAVASENGLTWVHSRYPLPNNMTLSFQRQ